MNIWLLFKHKTATYYYLIFMAAIKKDFRGDSRYDDRRSDEPWSRDQSSEGGGSSLMLDSEYFQ